MADDKTKSDKKPAEGEGKKDVSSTKPKVQTPVTVVKFDGNIEIFPSKPLPSYDSLENKAYKAVSRGRSSDNLIAIVCERHLVPRRNAAERYASIINPALLPLVSYGKVYWPPAKQERYVIVYKYSIGERFLERDKEQAMGWKQDLVMESIVKPMVNVLQDFRDKDFVHGAIRPGNMFQSGKGSEFVLGDCLSAQASYTQPSIYEPIERAQADAISRGSGMLADDIYAFGVSLAVILRSSDPLEGKSDEEIIREKVKVGSYAAVTGKDRFKGSILELLRGLLHDEPSQRWTVDEILVWLDGRRLSPKQSSSRAKSARPILFNGEKFVYPQLLAMALDKAPSETVKLVEDGVLEQWLTRSLEDSVAVDRLKEAYQSSIQRGRGPGYEDRLVSNVSSLLDAMAPLRFRGLCMSGDGVGNALYDTIVNNRDVKLFADMFTQSVAMNWVTTSENPNVAVSGWISKFDFCRSFLRQNKIGVGIERCLYTLSPDVPCLSLKLKDYYVSTPEEMMSAFESVCEKGDSPALFIDRHVAAFLSMKDSKIIDAYLYDINSPDDHKNLLANLKVFAIIQKRSGLDPFPHIAKAFQKRLPTVYKRFHDQDIRDKLKENIDKYVKLGDLVKMANLLDSPDVHERDMRGYKAAMVEYAQLKLEEDRLSRQLEDEGSFGRGTGRDFAALISGGLAALFILVTTYMFMSGNSIF
ncbi:MAG: hypothetical protein GW778_02565 [Alphaproteobacteria bacterium]|nr:hypothetical protein [Alphaproteobacteria bacterium]